MQLTEYRHGDVHLQAIETRAIEGLTKLPAVSLAEGTATGHSHRIDDPTAAEMYSGPDGTKILVASRPVTISHEEHNAITLPPGSYRVSIKRQFDESLGQRNVED